MGIKPLLAVVLTATAVGQLLIALPILWGAAGDSEPAPMKTRQFSLMSSLVIVAVMLVAAGRVVCG